MGHRLPKEKLKKYILAIIALAAVILLLAFGSSFLDELLSPGTDAIDVHGMTVNNPEGSNKVLINNKWYTPKDDIRTLLLIGVDDVNNADFLTLLVVNDEKKKCDAIQLDRDTMTNVPLLTEDGTKAGTSWSQLALSFHYGDGNRISCENTVNAVSYLLYDMEIDNYVAIHRNAIPILNDDVGGVIVDGKALSGKEALELVTARMSVGSGTNVERMERQRKFMTGWLELAKEKYSDTEAVAVLIRDLGDYMLSDLSLRQIENLSDDIKYYAGADIHVPEGTTDYSGEYAEFNIDDEALQNLILDLFYDESEE